MAIDEIVSLLLRSINITAHTIRNNVLDITVKTATAEIKISKLIYKIYYAYIDLPQAT